jgi:putative zinc finger/helix-turn-helix YgiT family protein
MTRTKVKTQSRCGVCGEAELQPRVRTERFEYEADGQRIQVVAENVPVRICPACGESFSGPEAGRIREEAICRALGLLTPADLRGLRDRLGLSQADFARLTGIGEASICRWETGQLIQSRAMDRYLRLLIADPENVKHLKRLSDPGPVNAQSTRKRPRRTILPLKKSER